MTLKKRVASVIIPTYNEEEDIARCLSCLKKQTFKDFEVIIVDDGSSDKTVELVKNAAKTFNRLYLIQGEHKGPGFSRNLGAKRAKGKILIFIDADMFLDKNYLKALITPILNKAGIGTEDGYQLASNKEGIWSKCWGQYTKSPEERKKDYRGKEYNTGYIFRAILKSEFNRMGGFDPSLGYADDLTFYLHFNATSLRVRDAWCYHKNPETLKQVYKQSKWIGASLSNWFTRTPAVRHLFPISLIVLSPVAIPVLSIKKCYTHKTFNLLFPWMFIFIASRYFGTIQGLIQKAYLGKNFR